MTVTPRSSAGTSSIGSATDLSRLGSDCTIQGGFIERAHQKFFERALGAFVRADQSEIPSHEPKRQAVQQPRRHAPVPGRASGDVNMAVDDHRCAETVYSVGQ